MELVFATNNQHKLGEIRQMLQNTNFTILSLKDIGCFDEIPETMATIEGNSFQKARYIIDRYHLDCFADDTGLKVKALGGAPGVYSARYAGEGCTFDENINKLLNEMKGMVNRKACFTTAISLIRGDEYRLFRGEISGVILTERRGTNGFGYDPVFMPEGYDKSFAEMDAETKNGLSHRYLAMKKLIDFLIQNPGKK
jgi:XTP/dITP diphosphohydrolase